MEVVKIDSKIKTQITLKSITTQNLVLTSKSLQKLSLNSNIKNKISLKSILFIIEEE